MDRSKAIYYVNAVAHNSKTMKDKSPDKAIPSDVRKFFSFVADRLLGMPCYTSILKFAEVFERVQSFAPECISPICDAITRLSKASILAKDTFSTEFLSEWPARQLKFDTSQLFSNYDQYRVTALIAEARKNHSLDDAVRCQMVSDLLARNVSAEVKEELELAHAMLSTQSEVATAQFLLAKHDRFKLLGQWFDKHKLTMLEPLARKSGVLADVSDGAFLLAARYVIQAPGLLPAVQHPASKLVLQQWQQAHEACKSDEPDNIAANFVDALFMELAVQKTGLAKEFQPAADASACDPKEALKDMTDDQVKTLCKCLSAISKKQLDAASANWAALKEKLGQIKDKEEAAKPKPEVQPADVGTTGLSAAVPGAPSASAESSLTPASGNSAKGPCQATAPNGTVLYTISSTNKAALDNKRAVVTTANAASCWVELQEGPDKSSAVKRTWKQVRFPSPEEIAAAEPTSEAESKKARVGSKAAAIFGKQGLSDAND